MIGKVTVDTRGLERRFANLRKNEIPSAIRNTLNDLAFDTRGRMIDEMRKIFDRPTPSVLRVPYIKPKATKTSLSANLFLSDYQSGKRGSGPSHAITHHMTGQSNVRGRKGIEKRLESAGLLGKNEWLVPAVGAKLDQYGNVRGSDSLKMLADIGALDQFSGDASNTKAYDRRVRGSKGKTRIRRAKPKVYVWVRRSKASFATNISGIFKKDGDRFVPVYVVVRSTPRYAPRYRWKEIVSLYTAKRLQYHADRAIKQAISKRG